MDKKTLESLADEALEAFWNVVAIHYPEPETGDLSPQTTVALHVTAETAISEWVDTNVRIVCKTCGSEIVSTINDSNFREGECGPCEYRRYSVQPQFADALDTLLAETVDFDLAQGIELTDRERNAREQALALFTKTIGKRI